MLTDLKKGRKNREKRALWRWSLSFVGKKYSGVTQLFSLYAGRKEKKLAIAYHEGIIVMAGYVPDLI